MSGEQPRPVRITLQITVALITVAAWWITWSETRHMGLLMQLGVPMSLGMEGSASLASFAMFSGMWTIMMVAMMLPSTYPTLLLHHSVYSQRHRHSAAGTWLFAFGYFAVWALAGALFYLLYVGIGYLRSAMAVSDATVVRF